MENNESCCLAKILKVIDVLQKNAKGCDILDEGCTKPFLGSPTTVLCFNTRPITLYTRDGTPLSIVYDNLGNTSNVFRVEDVNDCCAKLRVLIPNTTSTDPNLAYISTNVFFTVNLKCMCVLKCLNDIIIDCV